MTGYLQRFFNSSAQAPAGRGASSGLLAPAHRPTSPLFSPDLQVNHTGFDQAMAEGEAIADEAVWPTPSVDAAKSEGVEQPPSIREVTPFAEKPVAVTPNVPWQPNVVRPASDDSLPQIDATPDPLEQVVAKQLRAEPLVAPSPDLAPAPALDNEPTVERTIEKTVEAVPAPRQEDLQRPTPAKPVADASPALPADLGSAKVQSIDTTVPEEPMATPVLPKPQAEPAVRQKPANSLAAPTVEPAARQTTPLPHPAPHAPDWGDIEGRVESMVRHHLERHQAGKTETPNVPDQPDTKHPGKPSPRPMTAAEASVIGKINAARRPSMILGVRRR